MDETSTGSQRKRTLEALGRRFAQAKAELQIQEKKNKKRKIVHKEGTNLNIVPSSADPSVKKCSDASSRKGNISFKGRTSGHDKELKEPAYLNLSHPVHENLLSTGSEVSDRKIAVNQVLHDLFEHGDSAQKYMQGSKSMKIESTILLDNHVQKSCLYKDGHLRALKSGSKRSKRHFSRKQHKINGLFDLSKEFQDFRFEIFKPMHEKWKSYSMQLLKIVGKDSIGQCFLKADLHGAIILVVECKIAAYIGVHGIMIRETKEAFGIITPENKFRGWYGAPPDPRKVLHINLFSDEPESINSIAFYPWILNKMGASVAMRSEIANSRVVLNDNIPVESTY